MGFLQTVVHIEVWLGLVAVVLSIALMLAAVLKGVTEAIPGALLRPVKPGFMIWCLVELVILLFLVRALPIDGLWVNLFLAVILLFEALAGVVKIVAIPLYFLGVSAKGAD